MKQHFKSIEFFRRCETHLWESLLGLGRFLNKVWNLIFSRFETCLSLSDISSETRPKRLGVWGVDFFFKLNYEPWNWNFAFKTKKVELLSSSELTLFFLKTIFACEIIFFVGNVNDEFSWKLPFLCGFASKTQIWNSTIRTDLSQNGSLYFWILIVEVHRPTFLVLA